MVPRTILYTPWKTGKFLIFMDDSISPVNFEEALSLCRLLVKYCSASASDIYNVCYRALSIRAHRGIKARLYEFSVFPNCLLLHNMCDSADSHLR